MRIDVAVVITYYGVERPLFSVGAAAPAMKKRGKDQLACLVAVAVARATRV